MRAITVAEWGSARGVAFVAAAGASILYFLIGLGALEIGRPVDGSTGDLLGFGLTLGTTFALVALLAVRARARRWWVAIGALQVLVIAGYLAFASFREPPVEPWGLTIKVLQAVLLVVAAIVTLRAGSSGRETATPGRPSGVDAASRAHPAPSAEAPPSQGGLVGVGAGIGGGLGLVFALLLGSEMSLGLVIGAAVGVIVGLAIPLRSRS